MKRSLLIVAILITLAFVAQPGFAQKPEIKSMSVLGIPAGKIYDAADIANDPHYQAREMLLKDQLPDGTQVTLPGIVPKLMVTPGTVRSRAPELGEHTEAVLKELGMSEQDVNTLKLKETI